MMFLNSLAGRPKTIIFSFLVFIIAIISVMCSNKPVRSLITDNYQRQNGKFNLGFADMRTKAYKNWVSSGQRDTSKSLIEQLKPSIKKNIFIKVSLEEAYPKSAYEQLDIFIDGEKIISGEYPTKPDYIPFLPKTYKGDTIPRGHYNNSTLKADARILILLHKEKTRFDTIIPLRYSDVKILHLGDNFEFRFEKGLTD